MQKTKSLVNYATINIIFFANASSNTLLPKYNKNKLTFNIEKIVYASK